MAKKLLLVEDNLSIQHIVRTVLQADDFEVVVTSDATAGLRTLESWIPDIVLADVSMPGIDGFQLCQIIRNTASVRHVPVLLLTSRFTAYDAAKGEQVGVTEHLPKPFDSQTLLEIVQRLVASHPQAPGAPLSTDTVVAVPQERPPVPSQEASVEVLPGLRRSEDVFPQAGEATAALLSPALTADAVYAALGKDMIQVLHQSLETQIASLLEKITPQIVEAVRDAVMAQVPPLLATLLQQEIDRLKQTVHHDDMWSRQS